MSTQEPGTKGPAVAPMPEPTFGTARRGYDPRQVSEHITRMAGRMQILERHVAELETELEQPRGTGAAAEDPYGALSGRMADVMRAFDQDVEKMRLDAETEATRIRDEARTEADRAAGEIEERRQSATAEVDAMLAKARAEADRIRLDAQSTAESVREKADRALEDAKERANAMLSELTDRREALIADLRELHDRMLESAGNLEPVIGTERAEGDVVIAEEGVPA
jgi:cell division septum initiation protein DivIVA